MAQSTLRVFAVVAFTAALVPVFSLAAAAGTTGFVIGRIVDDKSHNGVRDEIVTATSSSAKIVVRSDKNGNYSMLSLPPDVYVISAERPGYETTRVTNVYVTSDQTLVINLQTTIQK